MTVRDKIKRPDGPQGSKSFYCTIPILVQNILRKMEVLNPIFFTDFLLSLLPIPLVSLHVNNRWVFCAYRGTLRVPREAASAPPTGPLQRTREARRQRERPAAALLRPHAHADHRRGQHSYPNTQTFPITHLTAYSTRLIVFSWLSKCTVQ